MSDESNDSSSSDDTPNNSSSDRWWSDQKSYIQNSPQPSPAPSKKAAVERAENAGDQGSSGFFSSAFNQGPKDTGDFEPSQTDAERAERNAAAQADAAREVEARISEGGTDYGFGPPGGANLDGLPASQTPAELFAPGNVLPPANTPRTGAATQAPGAVDPTTEALTDLDGLGFEPFEVITPIDPAWDDERYRSQALAARDDYRRSLGAFIDEEGPNAGKWTVNAAMDQAQIDRLYGAGSLDLPTVAVNDRRPYYAMDNTTFSEYISSGQQTLGQAAARAIGGLQGGPVGMVTGALAGLDQTSIRDQVNSRFGTNFATAEDAVAFAQERTGVQPEGIVGRINSAYNSVTDITDIPSNFIGDALGGIGEWLGLEPGGLPEYGGNPTVFNSPASPSGTTPNPYPESIIQVIDTTTGRVGSPQLVNLSGDNPVNSLSRALSGLPNNGVGLEMDRVSEAELQAAIAKAGVNGAITVTAQRPFEGASDEDPGQGDGGGGAWGGSYGGGGSGSDSGGGFSFDPANPYLPTVNPNNPYTPPGGSAQNPIPGGQAPDINSPGVATGDDPTVNPGAPGGGLDFVDPHASGLMFDNDGYLQPVIDRETGEITYADAPYWARFLYDRRAGWGDNVSTSTAPATIVPPPTGAVSTRRSGWGNLLAS